MELQSATVGKIAAALVAAQAEFPAIPKDKTAKVPMKNGGSYSYKYADYNTIREKVQPTLSKYGLSYAHLGTPDGGLATTLFHESGEWLRSLLPIYQGQNGGSQGYGSGKTYAERYGLCGILGISADADEDGARSSGQGARRAPPPKTIEPEFDPSAAFDLLRERLYQTTDLSAWKDDNAKTINKLFRSDKGKWDDLMDLGKERARALAKAPPEKNSVKNLEGVPFWERLT